MSGFKRFFLRPARTPFWQRTSVGEPWPGIAALAVGGGSLFIAMAWWDSLTTNAPGMFSTPAEGADKVWSYMDAVVKTAVFWVVGAVATVIGAVQLLIVMTGKLGMRIADRVRSKKEKDG